ncbi:MAG: response regulator transcription factor [Chitinophagaceae bacterium]|nr:response regulator transcription factor [Chitinophagaceae bacterium]
MIKAVHIEDEPRNIELLKSLLQLHCSDINLLGNAKNIPDAIQLIKEVNPDLVYLDIELNKGNAFELLEELKSFSFQVIFITAFNEYAVKAFRYNAVDYLLKPISITELKEATEKAIEKIKQATGNNNIYEVLKELKLNIGNHKIGLPVADGVVFINTEEIVRCEAKGSYSAVYLINKRVITSTKTLKEIEEVLTGSNFVRIHNSWIINTRYLKKYYRGKNSYMEMEDGSTVTISLRKKSDILSFLKDFE